MTPDEERKQKLTAQLTQLATLPYVEPLEIQRGKKAPIAPNWPTDPAAVLTPPRIAAVIKRGQAVGVRNRGLIGIDGDVLDARFASYLRERVRGFLGAPAIPYREGASPKWCIFARCDGTPFRKQVYLLRNARTDERAQIEIRSDGCQTVLAGPHPDGGEYRWLGEGSGDALDQFILLAKASRLPTLNEGQAHTLGAALGEWVTTFGEGWELATSMPTTPVASLARAVDHADNELTLDEAKLFLLQLAPERADDYPVWLKILAALHHRFAGTDEEGEAITLARDFSVKSAKYKEGDVEAKWASFKRDDTQPLVTLLTLRWLAHSDAVNAVVTDMNRHYAFVHKHGIMETPRVGAPEFITFERFREIHENRLVRVGKKEQSTAKLWMAHPGRREYHSTVFRPDCAPFSGVPSRERPDMQDFNLFPGWALTPSTSGSCELFLDHLKQIICAGDSALFAWVISYFAHIFQFPAELPGTAPVFISDLPGTGKTLVVDVLAAILGDALSVKIADREKFLGRFGEHRANKLLIGVEEAVWAGDKKAESILKDTVTSPQSLIEGKYVRAVQGRNCARIVMTTNHEWAVPAARDERRFAVFAVDQSRRGDLSYFAAIRQQMFHEGGCARLLHHLLHEVKVDRDLIRRPPATQALAEQQLRSADALDQWFFAVLNAGTLPGKTTPKGLQVTAADLVGSAEDFLRKFKNGAWSMTEEAIGKYLRRRLGELDRTRPRMNGTQVRCYVLPPLRACRSLFSRGLAVAPEWDDPEEGPAEWDGQASMADDPNEVDLRVVRGAA